MRGRANRSLASALASRPEAKAFEAEARPPRPRPRPRPRGFEAEATISGLEAGLASRP
jgi:hypothetical protein